MCISDSLMRAEVLSALLEKGADALAVADRGDSGLQAHRDRSSGLRAARSLFLSADFRCMEMFSEESALERSD